MIETKEFERDHPHVKQLRQIRIARIANNGTAAASDHAHRHHHRRVSHADEMFVANRDTQHCLCCSKCGRQFYAFSDMVTWMMTARVISCCMKGSTVSTVWMWMISRDDISVFILAYMCKDSLSFLILQFWN